VTVAGSDWETDTPRKFRGSLSAVTHAPFHVSMPHRLAECMTLQWWGKLVSAALLSLINEACVSIMLCYPPLEWTRRPRLCAGSSVSNGGMYKSRLLNIRETL